MCVCTDRVTVGFAVVGLQQRFGALVEHKCYFMSHVTSASEQLCILHVLVNHAGFLELISSVSVVLFRKPSNIVVFMHVCSHCHA